MALPNEQALDASRKGGVLEPADKQPNSEQYLQLAGLGSAFFKGFAKGQSKSVTGGSKVPLEIESKLLPGDQTATQTQKKLVPDMLSIEGGERFAEQGNKAQSYKQILETPTEDLTQIADDEFGVATEIADTAKAAELGQKKGLVSEAEAEEFLETKTKGIIKTDQGIDFNFDRLDTGDDIKEVLNITSEIIAKGTTQFKRGVVSNQQTLDEATELLANETAFTKEILKKKVGTTLNASQMTALRLLLNASADKLAKLSDEIIGGADSNENLLKFRRLMAIHSGLQMRAKGATTEIARALQAFNIPAGLRSPQVKGDVIQEILNESGGSKHALNLVKAYDKALKNGGTKKAAETTLQAWGSKTARVFHEVYINGLLAGTKTILKNGLATPLFTVYNQVIDLAGAITMAPIRSGKEMFGKEINQDGLFLGDIVARNWGMMTGFKDAWITGWKTLTTEIPASRTTKLENYNAIDAETLGVNGTLGKAVDFLGRVIRIPGAALQSTDDFWRVMIQRGALYEEAHKAYRATISKGGSEKDALDNANMILLDPDAVKGEVEFAGNRLLLTEDLTGFAGDLSKFMQRSFIGKLILPFAKAPTNSVRMVGEGHPLTVLFSKKLREDLAGKNGGQVQQQALGRMSVGSMTMMLMFQYADEGRLTGAMPKDPKIRAMLPKNWQPYSLVYRGENFPVDADGTPLPMYDKYGIPNGELEYVSYAGLEPVSAFIGIGADCAERRRRVVNEADREDLVTACTAATVNYFKNIPFLQGMSGFFYSMEYDDPTIWLKQPASNLVGIFPVPFAQAVRGYKKAKDPQLYRSSKELTYYTEADVNKLYKESLLTSKPMDQIPYELVGTIKEESALKSTWNETVFMFKDQMKNNPWYQKQMDDFQFRYTVLGDKMTAGVPSSANPVKAYWNVLTPFTVSTSEELKNWHKELIRIGMPLSEEKDSMKGIALSNARKGQLNFYAKDPKNPDAIKLIVTPNTKPLPFQRYLEEHMKTHTYQSANRKEKRLQISNIEDRFYEQAFLMMIAMPENSDLQQAYNERSKPYIQGAR